MGAIFHNANRGSHIQCLSILLLLAILMHRMFTFLCIGGPEIFFLSIKIARLEISCALTCLTIQMTAEIWHTAWVVMILADDFPPSFQRASQSQLLGPASFRKAYVQSLDPSLRPLPACVPFIRSFRQPTGDLRPQPTSLNLQPSR